MKHVVFKAISLTVIILMACSFTSQAAYLKGKARESVKEQQVHKALRGNVDVSRALAYSFADEKARTGGGAVDGARVPLGGMNMASGMLSPGIPIGYTYYDYQHNCSMGRMIGTGPHSGESGYAIVHMGWMYLPDKKLDDRSFAYAAYNSADHSLHGPEIMMTEDEYAGYVNVHVTPDNRALVGGNNDNGDGFSSEIRYQQLTGWEIWRVPDSVQNYGQNDPTEYAVWPKFFLQLGTDTVLHLAAQVNDNDINSAALMYFRKASFAGLPEDGWDYPPWIVDSVQCIAQDVMGTRSGDRVALAWVASLPYQQPECDTCSGITVYDGYLIGNMDNDVYYQESYDQGLTWQPRINITKAPIGEAALKAYSDLSMLYDTDDNLHLVWHAIPWPADLCWEEGGFCFTESWYIDNARLMHWSENMPVAISIANQVYPVQHELWDSCSAGAWALRIAKPTISECDGKLYTIWTQFNNPEQGVIDDCAQWGYDASDPSGAANGDIWLSVSLDAGLSWSEAINLTDSYTPHCDPKFADDCQSDYWASMTPYGRQNHPSEDWSAAVVVDPTGGTYTGDYYLDIQYVNDLDAGGIVQAEGTWTDNPIKWFRLPCVEYPPTIHCPHVSPLEFSDWIQPNESTAFTVTIENLSSSDLTYTVTVVERTGPEGWITLSGFDGVLQGYPENVEQGIVHLNENHVLPEAGYFGWVILDFPEASCTDTIEIYLDVFYPHPPPIWDTVNTNCLGLIANPYGNMGRGGVGNVNMDYVRYGGDCDTTATVYMYEGSPIVGYIIGDDTAFYSSIWGASYTDELSFRPDGGYIDTKYCPGIDAEVFQAGIFITQDSAIGMEKIYVAPQSECNFIIEYRRVWSWDGEAHAGIIIAEGIDWDIPTDYLIEDTQQVNSCCNIGGVDATRNLVYCQGYEAYGAGSDTTYPYNCQYNDARFGGNAFVESYFNGSQYKTDAVRGFVGTNDSLQGASWLAGPLYQELTYTTGLTATDSIVDLNTVLAFETDLALGATDVYEAVTILATIKEGTLTDFQTIIDDANAWYAANGGISMFADANDDGQIDVCEGCCMTMGNFYSPDEGGDDYFSILDIDDFTEWMLRNPGVPPTYSCFEEIDVSGQMVGVPDGVVNILDLDYMIGYMLRDEYPDLGECP